MYSGQHCILGWYTYPGMAHLPGNFNSRTLTWPMKLLSSVQPAKFLGVHHTQSITREIPGCTATIMQPSHVLGDCPDVV